MSESYFEKQFVNKLFIYRVGTKADWNRLLDRKWRSVQNMTCTFVRLNVTKFALKGTMRSISQGHFFERAKMNRLIIDTIPEEIIKYIKDTRRKDVNESNEQW